MKIILSKNRGFCNGVTNAVNYALKALKSKKENQNVYSYGEIVHNKTVIDNLCQQGLKVTDDLSILNEGDVLIIRSHGATPEVFDYCKNKAHFQKMKALLFILIREVLQRKYSKIILVSVY